MNLTGKLDLDGLLRSWPAPEPEDGAAWGEQAARITQAAITRPPPGEAAIAAALAAPSLDPEPGEPGAEPARAHVRQSGETRMSQPSDDQDEGRTSAADRPSMASGARSGKRMSLKEIAERASQPGFSAPPSRSGIATPVPPAITTPVPPALATPIPSRPGSIPPVRPSEAGKEDSGVVNLKAVTETATPEQKAAAANAQPGQTDLVFEEGSRGDDEVRTERRPAVPPPSQITKKKGSGGLVAGAVIAVVGLAASFAIMQTRKPADQPTAAAQAEQAKPAEPTPSPVAEAKPAPSAAPEQPAGMDPSQLPEAKPEDGKTAQAPTAGAGAAAGDPAAPAAPAAPGATVAQAPAAGGAKPATPAKPGDLNSAMQQAVGDQGAQGGATETPEPAAGKPLTQSIPEQPPQGAVQAAIRSVMPAAKACVAGADDVTRANVTFSSAGGVSSVSVNGWAASHGQTSCIKSAFQGAKVGPFSKPSFSVGVTVRP